MNEVTKKAKLTIFSLVLAFSVITAAAADQPALKEAPPDYGDRSNWAYYQDSGDKKADLFFVCPTVDLGEKGNANMRISDEECRRKFTGATNMEIGIYDRCADVFAPYYRQMTLKAYDDPEGCEMAYSDVRAAFLHYLSTSEEDRPIILAGFSQGSEMLIRLMKELFGDERLQDRLVAAYCIGWRVTAEDLEGRPWMRMAKGESDTGVIVSFNSESEETEDSLLVPRGVSSYGINPLNWTTDGTPAPASMNLGACFTDYSGEIVKEKPALTGARMKKRRGTLVPTDVSPDEYPAILFERGVYHLYDYQFFYRNLQRNVEIRLKSYLNKHPLR